MADKKTSEFDEGGSLTGPEIIGVVQDGANVRSTIADIAQYAVGDPDNTMIGNSANHGEGSYTISIGSHSYTRDNNSIAIGNESQARYSAIAIGRNTFSMSFYGTAIGNQASTEGESSVAIGTGTGAWGDRSIAIGNESRATGNWGSIGIGSYAEATGTYAIAMGSYSYGNSYATVAIGYHARAGNDSAMALGYDADANGPYSVATVGSRAIGLYSLAFGGGYARKEGSVVFGNVQDQTMFSFVTGGFDGFFNDNPWIPTETSLKLMGSTISGVKASAAWGNGSYLAHVRYDTPGIGGNDYTFALTIPTDPDVPLSAGLSASTFSINLETNSDGDLNSPANTLNSIAGLFPVDGFSFAFTGGFGESVVAFSFTDSFAGGSDATTPTSLTADGASANADNQLSLSAGTMAHVTGQIIGYHPNAISSGTSPAEAATFVLSPVLLRRESSSGNYSFIGTPTFTLESSTDGASAWTAPTLEAEGSDVGIFVEDQNDGEIAWMAFLKLKSNQ